VTPSIPNVTFEAADPSDPTDDDYTGIKRTPPVIPKLEKNVTTVQIKEGALEGDIYRYIGPTVTDSDPNTPENQPFDLTLQQYRDSTLWKHVSLGENAAQVRARLINTTVHASGDLDIHAHATEQIDAVVIAVAVGVGLGVGNIGVAVSGAGVYSENKIKIVVVAAIEGDGPAGVTAGEVTSRPGTRPSSIQSPARRRSPSASARPPVWPSRSGSPWPSMTSATTSRPRSATPW
jgi:hypothetical protein